jgi:YesN/AraC family two-component response regulator
MLMGKELNRKLFRTGGLKLFSALKDTNTALEKEQKYGFYHGHQKYLGNSIPLKEIYYDERLCDVVEAAGREAAKKNANGDSIIGAVEKKLVLWQTARVHKNSVDAAVRFIRENYSRKIKRNDIAASAGLSVSYLSAIFTQIEKKSIMDYLLAVRVDRAKQLLEDEYKLNIAEVAKRTGFVNSFYFSRKFKQLTGLSPKEHRARTSLIVQ